MKRKFKLPSVGRFWTALPVQTMVIAGRGASIKVSVGSSGLFLIGNGGADGTELLRSQ